MMQSETMIFTSPIDTALWVAARWVGVAYLAANAPGIGLVFQDEGAARKIFEEWRRIYTHQDTFEELRISIVEGDIPGEEIGYSMNIGSNMDRVMERARRDGHMDAGGLTVAWASRLRRMPPGPGLEVFKRGFAAHGRYQLFPVVLKENGQPTGFRELAIEKKAVLIRTVAAVKKDPNDLDQMLFGNRSSAN